jgi:hypothetical protein
MHRQSGAVRTGIFAVLADGEQIAPPTVSQPEAIPYAQPLAVAPIAE